jgi:hypothetical protein
MNKLVELLELEIANISERNKNDNSFDNGIVSGLRMAINRAKVVDKQLKGE